MRKQKITETIIEDSKKIKQFLKKLPKFLAFNAFWFIMFLVAIDLVVGGVLFYKYIYLVNKAIPVVSQDQMIFKDVKYQKILDQWQKREKVLNQRAQDLKSPF